MVKKFSNMSTYYKYFSEKIAPYIPNSSDKKILSKHYNPENPYKFLKNFKNIKNPLLFLKGVDEWYNAINCIDHSYKSGFMIDFDQTCSGAQILSFMSKDEKIAELTNLTTKNKRKDLYSDFLTILIKELINHDTFSFFFKLEKLPLLFTRPFAKSIIMPFYYGMGLKGIKIKIFELLTINKPFINLAKNLTIENITDNLSLFIYNLCKKNYPLLFDYFCFLKNLAKIHYNYNAEIFFKTLDNSIIHYKYLKSKKIPKQIKSLVNHQTLNFTQYVKSENLDELHYTTFAPNFVQAIDGAIARLLVAKIYKKYDFIIEPLHDSFRVHPSQINKIYPEIKKLYIKYFLNGDLYLFESFICISPLSLEGKNEIELLYINRPQGSLIMNYLILKKARFMFSV